MHWLKWLKGPFSKYADFSGRASRQEYWMFMLSVGVFYLLCTIMAAAGSVFAALTMIILILFGIAAFIPGIALFIRRLHDTGRSGAWWFISFIPLIGPIVLLVFLATEGDAGVNQYGPNPKTNDSEEPIQARENNVSRENNPSSQHDLETPTPEPRPIIKMKKAEEDQSDPPIFE